MQKLKIVKMEEINPFVRHIALGPAEEGQKIASFTPGQFISLAYDIDGSTCTRPYSLTSTPRDEAYHIYLGKAGFTSSWAFDNLKEGGLVYGSEPFGHFTYEPVKSKQIVGIAGGFSVTPLHSIAKAIADGDLDAEMVLFSGWDSKDEILLMENFKALQEKSDKFKYVLILRDEEEAKELNAEAGYISLDLIKKYAPHFDLENAFYLAAGPKEMYETLEKELEPLDIKHFKKEIPGEAKDPRQFSKYLDVIGCYNVHAFDVFDLEYQDKVVPARADETIEVALERAGLSKDARCRSGACGSCVVKMEKGNVFVPEGWDVRTAEEKEQGLIHPCCSFPLGDIKIV
ncbi:MAG: iron-sulfur cluster-binding domain-containing protein [Clostridia bacterium]|nr:iron-sulfur cluster-binding domain-containing protein [Clostridia bacterium]